RGQKIKGSNYYKRVLISAQGDIAYLSNKGELVTFNHYSGSLTSYQEYIKDRCSRDAFNADMVRQIKADLAYRTLEKYYLEMSGQAIYSEEPWMLWHRTQLELARQGKLGMDGENK